MIVQNVTLQEGQERLELSIKKQTIVFRSRKPKVLYLIVKSVSGEAQKKIKGQLKLRCVFGGIFLAGFLIFVFWLNQIYLYI